MSPFWPSTLPHSSLSDPTPFLVDVAIMYMHKVVLCRRILRFNMLMKCIVYSFMHDDEESLELYETMLISVLGKNEEAAVTKFKQLM